MMYIPPIMIAVLANAVLGAVVTTSTSTASSVSSTSSSATPTSSTSGPASVSVNGPGPEYVGNCLTQKIDFTDKSRIFSMNGLASMRNIAELDTARYDMTIDYYTNQVKLPGTGGVELIITANPNSSMVALSPRMSTTRFMRYGKFSAYMSAPAVTGVVTTFIGSGPNLPDSALDLGLTDPASGDEIDFEIVGGDSSHVQSNVFYRGFKDLGVRGGTHSVDITQKHLYSVDWRHDFISWSIDGVTVRTYFRNSTSATLTSKQNPAQNQNRFFPDRAMKMQFALWSDNNNPWAGKFTAQTASAHYDYVDIQCYDDSDSPVDQWPLTNNPASKATIQYQPTQGVNGAIPKTAGPAWNGPLNADGTPASQSTGPNGGAFSSFSTLSSLIASALYVALF